MSTSPSKNVPSQPITLELDREYYFMPINTHGQVGGVLRGNFNTPYWTDNKFASTVVFINPNKERFSKFTSADKVGVYFIIRNYLPHSTTLEPYKKNNEQIYGGFLYNGKEDERFTLYPWNDEDFAGRKHIAERGMFHILPSINDPNAFYMANSIDKGEGTGQDAFNTQFEPLYLKQGGHDGHFDKYEFAWAEYKDELQASPFLLYPVQNDIKNKSQLKSVNEIYPGYIKTDPRNLFTYTSTPENVTEFSWYDYITVIIALAVSLIFLGVVLLGPMAYAVGKDLAQTFIPEAKAASMVSSLPIP